MEEEKVPKKFKKYTYIIPPKIRRKFECVLIYVCNGFILQIERKPSNNYGIEPMVLIDKGINKKSKK